MKETQTPNWGRRLLEGYIILVAGAFLVSFLIWANLGRERLELALES